MTKELDITAARNIIEYSHSLSGGATSVPLQQPVKLPGTNSLRSEVPTAQIQFASESGHWYDPKTGNQVSLKPGTWGKTYIKQGYVPGVTTITRQLHKEQLRIYDVNRAIRFAAEIVADYEIDCPHSPMSCDVLIPKVRDMMKAESDEIMGRGKELHAAIELAAQGKDYDRKWMGHIAATKDVLPIHLFEGNTEHSFATSRYGGKIDWHNDEWLLDFKTKPRIEDGKKLAYPEHCWQLAAYERGLEPALDFEIGIITRRCANVFIGVEDAVVVFHEWTEKDLLKGWRKFEALLGVWWSDYEN